MSVIIGALFHPSTIFFVIVIPILLHLIEALQGFLPVVQGTRDEV
jgi:hypothetical protein